MKHNVTAGRISGPTILLVVALSLATVALFGLAIQAGSGPFADSSVAPTAAEVAVGQQVGFAIRVVNSGPVTVSEVLVWNPLPTGTTYVSASGGAFPVVGGALEGGLPAAPPEGQAYDVRLHSAVPLAEPARVTGVAWLGDVPPESFRAPGLIVEVGAQPETGRIVDVAQIYHRRQLAFSVQATVAVRSHSHYLPFVTRPAATATPLPVKTKVVAVPLIAAPVIMTGKGATLVEAQAGPQFVLDSESLYAGVHHPDGYHPFYSVARTYLEFDPAVLESVPFDRVVQVDLVLYPNANDNPCAQVDVQLYAGTWQHLDGSAWAALGQPLATFRADEAVTSPFTVTLAVSEGLGKMVMTVDEAAVPPPSCSLNTLKAGFFVADPDGSAGTHLAIWIEGE
jgi:uncharacterized repeat protein (TIGR01451 family)